MSRWTALQPLRSRDVAARGTAVQAAGGSRAAIVALLLVQVIFATLHIVGKVVLAEIPALAFAASRVLIATPLLVVMAWRHDRVLPSARDWRALALLGLLGVFANQLLYLVGLRFTTATNAAILMPSIPVFTVAAAAILGTERLTERRIAGISLAAVGALVLLDPARLQLGGPASLGNLLVAGNCLCYAFCFLSRPGWRSSTSASFPRSARTR
jgi:drug/metabolite transporter (DMT)-like permease